MLIVTLPSTLPLNGILCRLHSYFVLRGDHFGCKQWVKVTTSGLLLQHIGVRVTLETHVDFPFETRKDYIASQIIILSVVSL